MFRTAILIISVALLVLFVNSWLKLRAQKPPSKQQKAKEISNEPMVRCEQCGLHVPKSKAIIVDGHGYCSREHQLAEKQHK